MALTPDGLALLRLSSLPFELLPFNLATKMYVLTLLVHPEPSNFNSLNFAALTLSTSVSQSSTLIQVYFLNTLNLVSSALTL